MATALGTPCRSSQIVTLVRKDGLRIPLHRSIVQLVSLLMDLTEAMGYDIIPGWTWGYACRKISGTNVWSNHASGASVDINAPVNPYASAAWHRRNANSHPFGLPRRSDIPQRVFELWEDHGFTLGVKYVSKPDPMHVEFLGSQSHAAEITARLKNYLGHPDHALPDPDKPVLPVRPANKESSMELIWVKDINRYYMVMPDGVVGLDSAQYVAATKAGFPLRTMNDSLFRHLHSGPRRVSFNDGPPHG